MLYFEDGVDGAADSMFVKWVKPSVSGPSFRPRSCSALVPIVMSCSWFQRERPWSAVVRLWFAV